MPGVVGAGDDGASAGWAYVPDTIGDDRTPVADDSTEQFKHRGQS